MNRDSVIIGAFLVPRSGRPALFPLHSIQTTPTTPKPFHFYNSVGVA